MLYEKPPSGKQTTLGRFVKLLQTIVFEVISRVKCFQAMSTRFILYISGIIMDNEPYICEKKRNF